MRALGRLATALLVMAAPLAATVVPAQASGSSEPTLGTSEMKAYDQPPWPAYFVVDGDKHYDVRYSEAGVIAGEYGYHHGEADVDTYQRSTPYTGAWPEGLTDVTRSAMGDLDGDGSVEVALAGRDGDGAVVRVLGDQQESFPGDKYAPIRLNSSDGTIRGLMILAPNNDTSSTQRRLVVITSSRVLAYKVGSGDTLTQVYSSSTLGDIDPASILDVHHGAGFDIYNYQPSRVEDAAWKFEVVYAETDSDGNWQVYGTTASYSFDDEAVDVPMSACVTCKTTGVDKSKPAVAARVTDAYMLETDTSSYRDRQWVAAEVFFPDDEHTGHVYVSPGMTNLQDDEQGASCHTDLDTTDPTNVPDLAAAAQPADRDAHFACVGVERASGTADQLHATVFSVGLQVVGEQTWKVQAPDGTYYQRLENPHVQIEYGNRWLAGTTRKFDNPEAEAKLTLSTVERATPQGGATTTVLTDSSFDFESVSENSDPPDSFALFSQWSYPVARSAPAPGKTSADAPSATGNLLSMRLPALKDTATIKVDDPSSPNYVAGAPIPIAVLAAPPTVAGAGQSGSAPTFRQSQSSSSGSGTTASLSVGATLGVSIEDPTGAYGVDFEASIDRSVDTETTTSKTVSVSESYSGTMNEDTVVYSSVPQYVFPGTVISSPTGVGLGSRAYAAIPAGGTTISSATLTSLGQRFPALFAKYDAETGRPGEYYQGLQQILHHKIGDPGSYMQYGSDGAAVDNYCLGTIDTSTTADPPTSSGLNLNPFLANPSPPEDPEVLVSASHLVQAGTDNEEGASFGIEDGQETSRVATTTVGASVSGTLDYVTAGINVAYGWGSSYTSSLAKGVDFSAGIGNIPNSSLDNEGYSWRMFLCDASLHSSDGGAFPVRVLNYTVDNYSGSGGLEPLSPITAVTPKESQTTTTSPTLKWDQDTGTVKQYDWQVEAVGTDDTHHGSVTFKDTVDSAKNRTSKMSAQVTGLKQNQLYRWRVSAVDFFGNTETSSWEYFVTEGPPNADFTATPREPDTSTPVTVTDTSDDGGRPVTERWDFRDGTVRSGDLPSVTHRFTTSGAHTVRLEVTNDLGSDYTDKVVYVIGAPQDDHYAATEDTALTAVSDQGVLANDDGVAETATVKVVDSPTHGTVTMPSDGMGAFTYQPDHDFCGTDGFTYAFNNGSDTWHQGTVQVTVACVNDAPTVGDPSFDVQEDSTLTLPTCAAPVGACGLLETAADVDGDALTVELVGPGPQHGKLDLSPDGSFSYIPTANYHGTDSFQFVVSDGQLESSPATATIAVTSVNDAPVAHDDRYTTTPGTALTVAVEHGVLANDTDVEDGVATTAKVVEAPAHGALELHPDGGFVYIPEAGFSGTDSFTYLPYDSASGGGMPAAVPGKVMIAVFFPSAPGGGSSGGGSGTGGEPPSDGGTGGGGSGTGPTTYRFDRVAGQNRYETAAKSATSTFESADTVLLANGADAHLADALAGNYLAGYDHAPILLTHGRTLPAATREALSTLHAHTVVILGGTGAVTRSQAHALARHYHVTRIGGPNRFATAAMVTGVPPETYIADHTAILAEGTNLTDALVSGPVSYHGNLPLLLTARDRLTATSQQALARLGIVHVLVAGGPAAVSARVVAQLRGDGFEVTRVYGKNRQGTAVALASYAVRNLGFPGDHVDLAGGDRAADALTTGPHTGELGGVLLLTARDHLGPETSSYLRGHPLTEDGHVFGGPAAVPDPVLQAANDAAGG